MSEVQNNSERYVTGVLSCNANGGFGFVRTDTGDEVFIPRRGQGKAFDRDTVLVKIDAYNSERGHREGHVERVLKRGNSTLIGVVRNKRRDGYRVSPDRRAFFSRVRVEELNGARIGDRVMVEITGYNRRNKPLGRITAIFGSADSVSSCIDGVIIESGIPREFPPEVIAEAGSVP
ncbi:MAG: hypothetical protein IJH94_03860, partial [Clostridia bacterium]|nr:hypothetical protein [Clostridia bacterium]